MTPLFVRPGLEISIYHKPFERKRTGAVALKSGISLSVGDMVYSEITSRKEGFVYLYHFAGPGEYSQFIFPSSKIPQDNYVKKGDNLVVPEEGYWIVDPTEHKITIFLLYSTEPIKTNSLPQINKEILRLETIELAQVKGILEKYFSIDKQFELIID